MLDDAYTSFGLRHTSAGTVGVGNANSRSHSPSRMNGIDTILCACLIAWFSRSVAFVCASISALSEVHSVHNMRYSLLVHYS